MTEKSQTTPKASDRKGESALEREAEHVDKLMNSDPTGSKRLSDEDLDKGEKKLRVEQDNRVAQVKAEAKKTEHVGEKSGKGVNPDG